MQNQKTKKYITFALISFFSLFILSNIAFADGPDTAAPEEKNIKSLMKDSGKISGYVNKDSDVSADLPVIIGSVVKIFISILGVVFILLMLYAGFLWMTARGNEEMVEKSKELMTNAVIGIIIVVAAYVVTYFVMDSLTSGNVKTDFFNQPYDIPDTETNPDEMPA